MPDTSWAWRPMIMSAAATSPLTGISRACKGTTPLELNMWEKKEYNSAGAVEGDAAARFSVTPGSAPGMGQTLPRLTAAPSVAMRMWRPSAHGRTRLRRRGQTADAHCTVPALTGPAAFEKKVRSSPKHTCTATAGHHLTLPHYAPASCHATQKPPAQPALHPTA